MPTGLAEYLAVQPRYLDGTMVGGSSYELHVEHAAAAIAAGLCEVVVGVYAATPRSDRKQRRGGNGFRGMPGPNPMLEWEMPYGLRMPMGAYALAASRHMAQYGTTSEQLAQIAVDTRRWAALNPNARYRDPITIDDVLASPLQVSPLHLLDCCLVTDGAGAFVMTSAERARDLPKPPAYVLGAATCGTHSMITEMHDLTTTGGAVSGPAAFAMAGIKPADVDLLMGYDSFTITALLHLEDLGFCAKGEGGAFVEDGKLGPGWIAPDEHERRRAVVHAPGPVRDVPPRRGGAAAARRVRRAPAGRPAHRRRARFRRRPVDDGHDRARNGSEPMTRWSRDDAVRTADLGRRRAVLGSDADARLRPAVVRRVRSPDLVPARDVSDLPRR